MLHTLEPHLPEHPNLVRNVVPVPWGFQLLRQNPEQLLAHVNYPTGHRSDVLSPLLEKHLVI